MTTRLVIAYGLMALMAAFAVTVALWSWYRSRARVEQLQRKRALVNSAERLKARKAIEAGAGVR